MYHHVRLYASNKAILKQIRQSQLRQFINRVAHVMLNHVNFYPYLTGILNSLLILFLQPCLTVSFAINCLTLSAIYRHIRSHNGGKLTCDLCPTTFNLKDNLNKARSTKTSSKSVSNSIGSISLYTEQFGFFKKKKNAIVKIQLTLSAAKTLAWIWWVQLILWK